MRRLFFIFTILVLNPVSCRGKGPESIGAQGKWIKGTEEEKLKAIDNPFRGFDKAMVETGYRYQGLYWAGQDENWEYAYYQLEKIKTAIESGLERRPKRAASASHFLTRALPEVEEAVEAFKYTINVNFHSNSFAAKFSVLQLILLDEF